MNKLKKTGGKGRFNFKFIFSTRHFITSIVLTAMIFSIFTIKTFALGDIVLSVENSPTGNKGAELISGEANTAASNPGIKVYFTDKDGTPVGDVSVDDLTDYGFSSGKGIYHSLMGDFVSYDNFYTNKDSSSFSKYMIIKKTDGSAFSFKNMKVAFTSNMTLQIEGYRDNEFVGKVDYKNTNGITPTLVTLDTSILLPSIFENVDEVRVTGKDYINAEYNYLISGTLALSGFECKFSSFTIGDPPALVGAYTAAASANTLTPVVGADDAITLTVKNTLGTTDADFDGAKNVTIKGVEAAPDTSYGSFNGTALTSDSAGAGQVISVTFTDGVATANLKLNKADAQTIGFSIATVTTPATNTLTITPTHGSAASMAVTQDITAPGSNGGQFAQQAKVTIKDTYGNICTGDNATVVTASKEDAGAWILTGTATATASSGVATFTNLGATNTALVNNAQLSLTATGLAKVTSATVTLPAPNVTGGSGSSGSGSSTATPPNQGAVIVIVNGKEQDAGKETKTTEEGKTVVTVEVNNTVIQNKIDEAVKNNKSGTGNIIQVPVADTKSEVVKVELTGDIVKKLEKNTFDVSVKRDNVEYVIPAEEFTISKVAENLGVLEKDLKDIKVEVQITKLDKTVVERYNEVAKTNGAELLFPPVAFEVVAKTTRADGTAGETAISKFSNYVERVMEIPTGIDPSKITTGIVFNPDGSYSHVPTEVFQKNGKWYAKLNSLTNSDYSVIWNPVTVKSVEKHWSKDAVNDMASRLVIFNPDSFAPDKAITRADFAEYIVRALGIYREGAKHENKFKDVSATGNRTLAILIASEYGIVTGYPDGNFKPDALITREEAMTMYQRAMKVTKLVGTDNDRYQSYTDYKQVGNWATPYVQAVLSAHVFNGTTATTISPKSNLTYAEAAQAIKNLLVESKLINK